MGLVWNHAYKAHTWNGLDSLLVDQGCCFVSQELIRVACSLLKERKRTTHQYIPVTKVSGVLYIIQPYRLMPWSKKLMGFYMEVLILVVIL